MNKVDLEQFVLTHPMLGDITQRYGINISTNEGFALYHACVEEVKTGVLMHHGYAVSYTSNLSGMGDNLMRCLHKIHQQGKNTQPIFARDFTNKDWPALKLMVSDYLAACKRGE